MALILLFSLSASVFATSSLSNKEEAALIGKISDQLGTVSSNKEAFGLSGVDFTNLALGNQFSVYRTTASGLEEVEFKQYPVMENGRIVAVSTVRYTENGVIETDFGVDFAVQLQAYIDETGNTEFALIYDDSAMYAYCADGSWEIIYLFSVAVNERLPIEEAFGTARRQAICTEAVSVKTFLSIPLPSRASAVLSIPALSQSGLPICWAASVASMVNYLKGTSYSAINIADNAGTGYVGAPIATAASCLRSYTSSGFTKYNTSIYNNSTMSFSTLKSKINDGLPIYVHASQSGGAAHAVVAIGYSDTGANYITYTESNTVTIRITSMSSGTFSFTLSGVTYTQSSYFTLVRYY